jgi:2-dehydropantoate 2-reductase
MKIAILGCGAMGSVYAGLLASAGHEVWAVDTWRDHVEAMRAKGLHLEGASGDRTVKVNATMTASDAGVCDLVIIATKARDVETAARTAKPLLGPQTRYASAGIFTLTDENSVAQYDTSSQAGVFSWAVDGTPQLFQ